jgi:hypothetical protein
VKSFKYNIKSKIHDGIWYFEDEISDRPMSTRVVEHGEYVSAFLIDFVNLFD